MPYSSSLSFGITEIILNLTQQYQVYEYLTRIVLRTPEAPRSVTTKCITIVFGGLAATLSDPNARNSIGAIRDTGNYNLYQHVL
jgi:hypothetical protein